MDLVARVAEDNVVVESDSPDRIGIFTIAQVKTVFATGAKMMDLPVGSTSNGNNSSGRGGSTSSWSSRIDQRAGSAMLLRKKGVRNNRSIFFSIPFIQIVLIRLIKFLYKI